MRKSEQKKIEQEAAERKAARMHILSIVVVALLVALGLWTYLINRSKHGSDTLVGTPEMSAAESEWINQKSQAIEFKIIEWKEAPQIGEGLGASYAPIGRKFVWVKVKATNTDTTEIPVVSMDLGLVADNGVSYKALTVMGGKTPPLSFAIAPGKSEVGTLAFEVDRSVRSGKIGFLLPQ